MEGRQDVNINRTLEYHEALALLTDEGNFPPVRERYGRERSSHKDRYDNWAGVDWKESVDLAVNGWSEPVAKIQADAKSKVRDHLRPTMVYGEAGSQIDMGAFLSGVPECMGEVVSRKRPAPVVRIAVDRAAAWTISEETLMRVGRSVLVVIEGLRLAGIPTEVWAVQTVSSRGGNYSLRIKIQDAGRPVDVSRLAYWVGHTSALRRSVFAIEECEAKEVREYFGFGPEGGGYGSPNLGYGREDFDEFAPSGQVSEDKVTKWVADVLARRTGYREDA
jgi:hypothetical protein